MNETEINNILSKGAKLLDITPSMFEEATSHYKAVGEFLGNHGIDADISPCGSILTGTVVRPYSENEDAYFDIDVLVNRPGFDSANSTPGEVRGPVDETLLESDRYGNMAKECDECITIEYVASGIEGGFRLDLNTCIDDKTRKTHQEYADSSVSMAWKNPERWHGSNPRGLCQWFIDKNERFAALGRAQRKARILEESRSLYASIEEVPDSLDRSEMQRAIQVLKRSRDEFYHRCGKSEKAPASCVVTVIVGRSSDHLPDNAKAIEFLESFIQYAKSLAATRSLPNPVYDEDLLQEWDDESFALLASWAEEIERSLSNLRCGTQAKGGAAVEAIFGSKIGKRAMPVTAAAIAPSVVTPSKPWSM
ncbi:nucleotidyltransferase family protein [Slackia equolifaciens]|uniref:hypothetical protein n=1 Tax=Slackia equolifaciens TaxID=498718 RepID=UPI00137ADD5D|nr:hypothetical protein [Slackia equolifaciens]